MNWLVIALFLGYVFVGTWAVFDAYERTDMGCLWLMLFILFPGISVIAYIIMRTYAYRPKPLPLELDPRELAGAPSRFGSEIEKARFIEAAARGGGTLYEPERHGPAAGYRHFTDERAEALLAAGRGDEAFAYLYELLELARSGGDARGADTYLYYIHRLPAGAELLRAREQGERIAGDARDGGGPRRPPPNREVPF